MSRLRDGGAWLRRHAEWFWAPALYAAATLFLYREVWLGERGALRWFGWDCLESYWPYLAHLRRALAAGELPLWNPYERGGFPFHADPEPGLFYPINWLFALLGVAIGGSPPWMIQAKALLHHALAGAMMHAYLRSRSLPRAAAAFGGMVALANGAFVFHKASSVFWPVVWAPLIWIAIDHAVERAGEPGWWRRGVALGGAVALAGSVGSPPGFFYALLTALAYGLLRWSAALVDAARARRVRVALIQQGRVLGIAALVTAALLLIIVVPALDLTALSPRAAPAADWFLVGPYPPGGVLRGLLSPALGDAAVYAGGALVALALVAVLRRPRDGGAPLMFLGFGLVLLIISFGEHTPVLSFLVRNVPVFDWFRAPQRYRLPAALLFAAAAAHGVAALLAAGAETAETLRARIRTAARLLAPLLLVGLVIAILWIAARPGAGPGSPAVSLGALAAVIALLAAVLLGARRAAVALALLPLLDVDHYLHRHSVARSMQPVDDEEDRRWIDDLGGDVTRDWRVYDEYLLEQRGGVRLGVRDFRGYPGGDPLQDARYAEVLRRAQANPELLQAFNVRWLFHGPHSRLGQTMRWIDREPPARHYRRLDRARWEARHPAPAVAWYGTVNIVADRPAALELLVTALGLGSHVAVVERGDMPPAERASLEGLTRSAGRATGRVTAYGLNQVTTEIEAPAPGLVVLNESYAPGWRATVDGRPARVMRANVILRAVQVPAGRHVIAWSYHPPRWSWLAPLWLLGVATLLAAAFAGPLTRAARRLRGSSILRAWRSGDARPPR